MGSRQGTEPMKRTRKATAVPAPAPVIPQAVIYCRVSSEMQAESGLGLEAQETRCRAYCAAQGWDVAAVYIDAGLSAKNLLRPELENALAALAPGRVLVAYKIDRLTRSVADFPTLHARIQEAGAELATVEERFDTSTAMGRAMLGIVLVFSQLEREQTGERTAAALQAKKERGERLGAIPLGWALGPNGALVPVGEELATVARAQALRREGRTFRDIAATLTREGHATKRGGKWEAATVRNLVKR